MVRCGQRTLQYGVELSIVRCGVIELARRERCAVQQRINHLAYAELNEKRVERMWFERAV